MHSRSPLVHSLFALALLTASVSAAEEPLLPHPDLFGAGGSHAVAEVIDGDSLRLEDGRVLQLSGIQAPSPPADTTADSAEAWPLGLEAARALETLIGDGPVTLFYGGNRRDRHERILAQATNAQGLWLQGALLRRGLARVSSYPDNRQGVAELLALEQQARNQRRGLWRHPLYAVRRPQDSGQDIGSFQLVEGRVLKVAIVSGRAYLNFGEDWRSDFTLVIEAAQRRQFEAEGLDPRLYEGRRVRARGWLGYRNGATITVTHPEQIEVLDR